MYHEYNWCSWFVLLQSKTYTPAQNLFYFFPTLSVTVLMILAQCGFFFVKFASLGHLQPLELRAVITLLLPSKREKESRRNLDKLNPEAKVLFSSGIILCKTALFPQTGWQNLPSPIFAWQSVQSQVLMQAPPHLLGLCASYLILQTLRT